MFLSDTFVIEVKEILLRELLELINLALCCTMISNTSHQLSFSLSPSPSPSLFSLLLLPLSLLLLLLFFFSYLYQIHKTRCWSPANTDWSPGPMFCQLPITQRQWNSQNFWILLLKVLTAIPRKRRGEKRRRGERRGEERREGGGRKEWEREGKGGGVDDRVCVALGGYWVHSSQEYDGGREGVLDGREGEEGREREREGGIGDIPLLREGTVQYVRPRSQGRNSSIEWASWSSALRSLCSQMSKRCILKERKKGVNRRCEEEEDMKGVKWKGGDRRGGRSTYPTAQRFSTAGMRDQLECEKRYPTKHFVVRSPILSVHSS